MNSLVYGPCRLILTFFFDRKFGCHKFSWLGQKRERVYMNRRSPISDHHLRMPALLVLQERGIEYLKKTVLADPLLLIKYDNGFFIIFDDWSNFVIAKLLLEDRGIFFQEFNSW